MSVNKSEIIKKLSKNYPNFLKKDLTKLVEIILIEIKYILEAYGESTYKRIININPLLLNIKDILRNRVEILKKKYYKNEEIKKLSLVKKTNSNPIFDINDFNPLLYDFDFESKKNQIYRVDNTDYLINILPRKYK